MVEKLAKTVRVITVAPFMALVMLTVIFITSPSFFGSTLFFALAVLFLTVLPLLAYPMQPITPYFRHKGRDGQRNLAILFAVAGYLMGCVTALCMHAPKSLLFIYLSYLLSCVFIILLKLIFNIKASGHACGVSGPFTILICFGKAVGFLGIPILLAVFWSSLKIKRHDVGQLIAGGIVPVVSMLVVSFMFRIF